MHSHTFLQWSRYAMIGTVTLFILVKVFLLGFVIKLGKNAHMLYRHVRFFRRYVETVPASIRDIEMEQAIIAGRVQRRCAVIKETVQTANGISAETISQSTHGIS